MFFSRFLGQASLAGLALSAAVLRGPLEKRIDIGPFGQLVRDSKVSHGSLGNTAQRRGVLLGSHASQDETLNVTTRFLNDKTAGMFELNHIGLHILMSCSVSSYFTTRYPISSW